MSKSNLKTTIGIVTYNSTKHINDLIKNLSQQTRKHLVIVVAAGKSEQTEKACQQYSNIKYIPSSHNNLGLNRNLAVEYCKTQFITFIDDDCIPSSKDWLANLEDSLITHSKADSQVVGFGGGQVYQSYRTSSKLTINNFSSLALLLNSSQFGTDQPKKVDHLPTYNSIFLRTALKSVQFPPTPFNTGEDLTLGWRLTNQGHTLLKAHSPFVFHYTNTDKWFKKMFLYGRAQIFASRQVPSKRKPTRLFLTLLFLPTAFLVILSSKALTILTLLSWALSFLIQKNNFFWTRQAFFPLIAYVSFFCYSFGMWKELFSTSQSTTN